MTPEYLQQWAQALLMTQIIEVPVYRFGFNVSWKDALIASFLTHPVVWFVIPKLISLQDYTLYFCVAESFAVLAEAAWLKMRNVPHPFLASLCANGLSASLGLLRHSLLTTIWP